MGTQVKFIGKKLPPPAGRGGREAGKYHDVLDEIAERPGEWGIIAEQRDAKSAANLSGSLRNGRISLPRDGYEFAARTIDGRYRVLARYVGGES